MNSASPIPLIRMGVAILIRPGGRIQVGCDPDTAVLIEPPAEVSPTRLATLLRSLTNQRSPGEVLEAAHGAGLTATDLRLLLDRLVAAGIAHHGSAELARQVRVRVHGSGPLADAITTMLHGCWARALRSVRRPQLVDAGNHDPLVRQDRMSAWAADLVVLTDYLTHDPWLVSTLMRHRVPHLMVRLRDGVGVIGPMVLPGLSSCLHCADHHRRDRDADWPVVSAQLLGLSGWASPATIAGTVAITQAQIEQVAAVARSRRPSPGPWTQHPPSTLDATMEYRASPSSLMVRHWTPHPLCGCASPR